MEETGDAVDLDTSSENSQQQWQSLTAVAPLPLDKTPTKGILLQSTRYVLFFIHDFGLIPRYSRKVSDEIINRNSIQFQTDITNFV